MASDADSPTPGDRAALEAVAEDFPFPLAITAGRLRRGPDGRQPIEGGRRVREPRPSPCQIAARAAREPIEAACRLRDAFECLIKFAASLAIADCLRDRPDPATAAEIVGTLFRPMALGDWATLLGKALRPLAPLHPRPLLPHPR